MQSMLVPNILEKCCPLLHSLEYSVGRILKDGISYFEQNWSLNLGAIAPNSSNDVFETLYISEPCGKCIGCLVAACISYPLRTEPQSLGKPQDHVRLQHGLLSN